VPAFGDFIVELATVIMAESKMGSILRLLFSGLVSILDVVTDLLMIYSYHMSQRYYYRNIQIAMVGFNLAFMLLFVILQNKGRGPKHVALECLAVVTFVKPGLDSYRVAAGYKMEEGMVIDPVYEMTVTKGAEILFESIPGSIIQVAAFISTSKPGNRTLDAVAIATSIAATALSTTMIALDCDGNPNFRRALVDCLPLIPDGNMNRLRSFTALWLFALVHCAGVSLACALVYLVSTSMLVTVLATHASVYLLFKAVRGDLHLYLPMEGSTGWAVSIVYNFGVHTIATFTGCPHFRSTVNVGGAYFAFTLIETQVGCYFASRFYLQNREVEEDESSIGFDEKTVKTILIAMYVAWVVASGLVLSTSNWDVIGSLWDTRTNAQYLKDVWWNNDNRTDMTQDHKDNLKVSLSTLYRGSWSAYEDDVRAYLAANWERFEEEKPKWWTKSMKSQIPDDLLPPAALSKFKGGGQQQDRRRSSFAFALASVRMVEDDEEEDEE
jgi:hypothetical protein